MKPQLSQLPLKTATFLRVFRLSLRAIGGCAIELQKLEGTEGK